MQTGAITDYIDVAQVVLYLFWGFFAVVLIHLRREDKREGYPLQSETPRRVRAQGFPAMPAPKMFRLSNGETVTVPNPAKDQAPIAAQPVAAWSGAPLEPTGNAMRDGVGPGAHTPRSNRPDTTLEGLPMVVPMRVAREFSLNARDPDPRGMRVYGADRVEAGVVRDLWVDRTEPQIRYLEITLSGKEPGVVLLPIGFARIQGARRGVRVDALLAMHFSHVPRTASADQITLDEEDRITAFYGAGTLYATPSRLGPWL